MVRSATCRHWWALTPWALAPWALAPLSACDRHLDVPVAPDLAPLATSYDHPSGELSPGLGPVVTAGILEKLEDAAAVQQLDWVRRALRDFSSAELDQTRRVPKGLEGRVDFVAVVQLHKECRAPAKQAARGTLELTGVLEEHGLFRTLWGAFTDCKLSSKKASAEGANKLTGNVAVRFDSTADHVPLGEISSTGYLVQFHGRVTNPTGNSVRKDIHFRIMPPDELALLHTTETGETFRVAVDRSALQRDPPDVFDTSIADQLGIWSCRIDRAMPSGACSDETGMRPPFSF